MALMLALTEEPWQCRKLPQSNVVWRCGTGACGLTRLLENVQAYSIRISRLYYRAATQEYLGLSGGLRKLKPATIHACSNMNFTNTYV